MDNKNWFLIAVLMALLVFQSELVLAGDEEELKIGWNNKLVGNLNFTQASFDNWSAGGENSWAWLFNVTGGFINKQERYQWKNIYKFEYGSSKVGSDEAKKSADEMFIESEYTRMLSKVWGAYGAVNGRTQFAEGFDFSTDPKTLTSKFFNPAYFRESVGMKFEPSEIFDSRAGVSLKQTVVSDEMFAPLYTDKSDSRELEKYRNEIGLESVSNLTYQIKENVVYVSNLDLFSNLKSFDEIDVRWDNLVSAEVMPYIKVNFNFQLYYDKDISSRRQLKQYLSVGLTYSVF
jgi:hypothetical protein